VLSSLHALSESRKVQENPNISRSAEKGVFGEERSRAHEHPVLCQSKVLL
jgi:hypothetical protein